MASRRLKVAGGLGALVLIGTAAAGVMYAMKKQQSDESEKQRVAIAEQAELDDTLLPVTQQSVRLFLVDLAKRKIDKDAAIKAAQQFADSNYPKAAAVTATLVNLAYPENSKYMA